MPSAFLCVPASPEHVRTARVVAVAAARRAGLDEERVDDVRLAVGEVVGAMVVGRGDPSGPGEIELVLRDEHSAFEVEVVDRPQVPRADGAFVLRTDPGDDSLALALVRALVPEVRVDGPSTTLSWPREA